MTLLKVVAGKRSRYGFGVSVLLFGNAAAWAEGVTPIPAPPLASLVDDQGVDLITGDLAYSYTAVSVGGGGSGLEYTVLGPSSNFSGEIYNLHVAAGALYPPNYNNPYYYYTVYYGNSSQKFKLKNGAFESVTDGGSLVCNTSECIYSRKDGTLVKYAVVSAIGGIVARARIKSVTKPDNEIITINRNSSGLVSSVTSSLGWMIKMSSGRVDAINNSVNYCDPSESPCQNLSVSWPFATVSGWTDEWAWTDALGNSTSYTGIKSYSPCNQWNYPCVIVEDCIPGPNEPCQKIGPMMSSYYPLRKITSITSPLGIAKSISYINDPLTVYTGDYGDPPDGGDPHWVGSITTGLGTWNYTFETDFYGYQTTEATDPRDGMQKVVYYTGSNLMPGIESYTNQLGKSTIYDYLYIPGIGHKISVVAGPERTSSGGTLTGGYTKWSYDLRGNVTEVRQVAKAASGLADIVTSASYDASCDNPKTCNKPNWVKDARLKQTDFTYWPDHGGIKTETLPADGNGVRRQTRYYYTELNPKIKNVSGVLENSTPVWRLTRTETCASSTDSCAGTSDETVTFYEYSHNNLLLTAKTVMAGNAVLSQPYSNTNVWRKTSYGYDPIGNMVWTDGPRTDVDDKTYTTFDALRRPHFEIGPDQDGSGPLKRVIVRHVYDADGNEVRTESGTGSAVDGSDFVVDSYKAMTYSPTTGKLVKTSVVQK